MKNEMITYEYGDTGASVVLIQPVDDHDMAGIGNEVDEIRRLTGMEFRLIAVKVDRWNDDLSPWKAPAVFGNEEFGGNAEKTLETVLGLCEDRSKTYYIGGYSLAGLFELWAVYQTNVFSGAAAASPSVWFPGFLDYMKEREIQCENVYLSLGDREEKTRNPVMASVGMCIRGGYEWLKERGVNCVLEWEKGNHFKEADLRTARAFAWVMENGAGKKS